MGDSRGGTLARWPSLPGSEDVTASAVSSLSVPTPFAILPSTCFKPKSHPRLVADVANSPVSQCQRRSFSKALCTVSRLEMEGRPRLACSDMTTS
eukprot:6185802-Pleurochrysis_carterae.AAC.6